MSQYAIDLNLPFETDMEHLVKSSEHIVVTKQWRTLTSNIDPRVLSLLKERRISLLHAEGFYTPPRGILSLHVDGPEMNNMTKLNWQFGAQGSKMLWWKLKAGVQPTQLVSKIGTRYLTMDAKDCIPVAHHYIKQPTLVNVGQPHSILNTTSEGRWVLSLVLIDDDTGVSLKWDEAVQRFADLMTPK